MGKPIAKQNDQVVALDTHVILIPSSGGPVPTPLPFPFAGPLEEQLSTTVFIDNLAVAVVGSVANNRPPHIPVAGPFQKSPSNRGTISQGSATVFVENKAVARAGDPATCCSDPTDQDTGHIVAAGVVYAE